MKMEAHDATEDFLLFTDNNGSLRCQQLKNKGFIFGMICNCCRVWGLLILFLLLPLLLEAQYGKITIKETTRLWQKGFLPGHSNFCSIFPRSK
jgi:hypothetical protein